MFSPEEAVQVSGMENGWCQVVYENQKAYRIREYLDFGRNSGRDVDNGQRQR